MNVRTVDLHAHYVSTELVQVLQREGKRFGARLREEPDGRLRAIVGDRPVSMPFPPPLLDPKARLAAMDQAGIELQAVSTWMDIVGYNLDVEAGSRLARLQNDTIAELVRAHPARFVGVATVPMQSPQRAVDELRRAVSSLGFRAVQIGTNVNGLNLDEPELEPFWAAAQELEVLVFLHPHETAGAERMGRYFLSNLVGNPVDTTLAAASLMFGGVLERFPRLNVLLAHGGGFVPYQLGRLDKGYAVRADLRARSPLPPSAYWPRFYCDCIVHGAPAARFLLETAGPRRVVLGTDYPFFISDPNPVQSLDQALSLNADDRASVLGRNALELLGIKR